MGSTGDYGQNNKKEEFKNIIKSFAAVVKGKKIYHITISNNTLENPPKLSTTAEWHVRLVVGEVSDDKSGKKKIDWTTSYVSEADKNTEQKNKIKTKPATSPPSDGFAFFTSDNNILFFMKSKATEGEGEKNITVVFQLKKKNNGKTLESLRVESTVDCHPLFFQWEGEIFMTPSNEVKCENQKMMVFNEKDKTFIDSNKPITRLRDFLKYKKYFTTATIGLNNVLLFTQQETKGDTSDAHLWMSDGSRAVYVEKIVSNFKGKFYGSILHTNTELFALNEIYNADGTKEEKMFSLTRLKYHTKNIADILTKWDNNEKKIKELCEDTSTRRIPCFTDGLVGFLSDEEDNNQNWDNKIYWKNKYLSVSAIVAGKYERVTAKVQNGYSFNGKGAGAQWPANAQRRSQPYNFTDPGFALVATVTIDKITADNDNSILGFCTEQKGAKKQQIGLWCTKEGKWSVSQKGETTKGTTGEKCDKDKIYQVAVSLKGQELSVYIDGKKMEELSQSPITVKQKEEEEKIAHFYFGVDNDEGQESPTTTDESHVTVTNVLLYNRPFTDSEIDNLKNYVKPAEVILNPDQNVDTNMTDNSDQQTTPPPQSSNNGEGPSSSRTADGGVGGGVRVFSLLLAVLCVSAPLLHL